MKAERRAMDRRQVIAVSLSSDHAAGLSAGTATVDPRWPTIRAALADLRLQRRCALRIVDADCGCGTLLIAAVRYARTLGFTAIEGRGIDGSPAMINRARTATASVKDPAIGLQFDLVDLAEGLAEEVGMPADIVIWREAARYNGREHLKELLASAGHRLVVDHAAPRRGRQKP
jgi:SAM-dependent methyltransferase